MIPSKYIKRKPCKSIEDISLPEDSYKHDFQIAERYAAFSSEIVRLALLGIAGYGFLISEIVMKSEGQMSTCFWKSLHNNASLLIFGVLFLGISLSLALANRFYSSYCLFHQINILHSLKRLANPLWQADQNDITIESNFLKDERNAQRKTSRLSHQLLKVSVATLAMGYIIVVIVFAQILLSYVQ